LQITFCHPNSSWSATTHAIPGLRPDIRRPVSTGEAIQPAAFPFGPYVSRAYYDSSWPGWSRLTTSSSRRTGAPAAAASATGAPAPCRRSASSTSTVADIDWISRHAVSIVMLRQLWDPP
jgi:hypothetical protein